MNGGRTTESWGACCESRINDLRALEETNGPNSAILQLGKQLGEGQARGLGHGASVVSMLRPQTYALHKDEGFSGRLWPGWVRDVGAGGELQISEDLKWQA